MFKQFLVELHETVIDVREIAIVGKPSESKYPNGQSGCFFFDITLKGHANLQRFWFQDARTMLVARMELIKRWGIEIRPSNLLDMYSVRKIV